MAHVRRLLAVYAPISLLWSNGTPSLSNDMVHMSVSGLPNNASTLLFQGTLPLIGTPFGDGLRCVAGNTLRLYQRGALCGNREYGYGVPGDALISVQGNLVISGNVYDQVRYRDANPTYCSVSEGRPQVVGPARRLRVAIRAEFGAHDRPLDPWDLEAEF
ncbi:MAG: hypothetical protein NTY35_17200 [Planctomycetota bacterium]|nr:hypothetical protein [Planctomycetota bacterium]